MDYQEIYKKYKDALELRELAKDDKYQLLKGIFEKKIVSSISLHANESIVPFLAGIKDVFSFVADEVGRIDDYKEQLENAFQGKV